MAEENKKKKSGIKINPAKKGSLRAKTKTKKGQNISEAELARLAKSKNKNTKAKAVFAKNAKKFKH